MDDNDPIVISSNKKNRCYKIVISVGKQCGFISIEREIRGATRKKLLSKRVPRNR